MSHSVKRHRKGGGYYPQASDTEMAKAFGGSDEDSGHLPHDDREGDGVTTIVKVKVVPE